MKSVAEALNVNCHTVKNWLKRKEVGSVGAFPMKEKRPQDWTAEQQLVALHQTHGLSGEALQTGNRENGLFAHHLTSWKAAFCANIKVAPGSREIRVLKDENEQLKRELVRKERALAEAALLARFCAAMHPSFWTPPSAVWRELRGWVDRLQALKDMHQQESNRMKTLTASGQTFLFATVQLHLDWLSQQIEQLMRDIDDNINGHPELKHDTDLLHSIPGIGSATVTKVLAYAGNVRRFSNAKALAAFIGVTPRQRLSGTSLKGRTMMSRTGHADLRRV